MAENNEVSYITISSPTFSFMSSLPKYKKPFRASNGLLKVPQEVADEIDELIASRRRPDIAQAIRKVDEKRGAEIVAAHKAGQRPAAVSGTVTHNNPNAALRSAMDQNHQQQTQVPPAQQTVVDATQQNKTVAANPADPLAFLSKKVG